MKDIIATSTGPSLNVILQWLFIVLTFGLAVIVIARGIFSKSTVTDPNQIPDSVYNTISDSLQNDYEFVVFSDGQVIENVDGIQFTNGLDLEATDSCTMVMYIKDCTSDCEALSSPSAIFNPDGDDPPVPFLFKLTAEGDEPNVQFPVPGDQCTYALGCKDNNCGSGKSVSWNNCP
tara:strand:- start:518 stop:1045 length:528 start_codon:yes stop_codon:yes gene_type:complete